MRESDQKEGSGSGALVFLLAVLVLGAAFGPRPAMAAPGDILFSDDFEAGGLSPWDPLVDSDRVGVNEDTAQSGSHSMFLHWGLSGTESPVIDADVPAAELEVWIRRGEDAFSEDPDSGEDLFLQYLNDDGNWQTLEELPGDGPAGETFSLSFPLPSNARHSGLQIRFVLIDGSGQNLDYWHIDDVTVTERSATFCPSGAAFSDSFEDGSLDWQTPGGGGGQAGVSQATAGNGSHSAFVQGGAVTVRSPNIDLAGVSSATLSIWVRRGSSAFSEDPDFGEDLVLEYRTSTGNTWAELQTFDGEGSPGEIFTPTFSLPPNALHANFRLRFRLTDGSGNGFDFWHFDNVCLTAVGGGRADHYAISHDGSAITCAAEPVTITAHNPGHQTVDPGNVTIDLDAINQSTGNGEGTWARVVSGSGTLSDATAGDGAASYTFPGGESSVTLAFNYTDVTPATDPETVSFNVNGGNEGAGEDPDLVVSRSGLRITDGSGNPIDIPDQIAGKATDQAPGAQTLGLQAVRASDGDPSQCEPAFPAGTDVEVELGAECKDPTTCAGRELGITNNGTTTRIDTNADNGGSGTASYEAVSLRFGSNAEAPIALEYSDAGMLQLHARYNPIEDGSGSPPVVEYVTGSSNDFAWRPFGLLVQVTGNPGATDATGPGFQAAGTDFDLTVTAKAYQGGDDDGSPSGIANDGVPDGFADSDATNNADLSDNLDTPSFGQEVVAETVDVGHTLYRPSGGNDEPLDPSDPLTVSGFASGSATATASWPEVGIIELTGTLTDGAYLDTGEDSPGRSGPVGRFFPDHFRLADPGLTDRVKRVCSDTFTYMAEDFRNTFDLEAHRSGGGITRNYEGSFAYLDPTDNTQVSLDAVDGSGNDRSGRLTRSLSGTFTQGTAAVTATLRVAKVSPPDGPFQPLHVGIAPQDPRDPVTLRTASLDLDVSGDGTDDHAETGATEIRHGRLRLPNAFGPETQNLDMDLEAQYFAGPSQGWQPNGDDSCTTYDATAFAMDGTPFGDDRDLGQEPARVAASDGTGPQGQLSGGTALPAFALECPGGQPGCPGGAANQGWVEVTPQSPGGRTDPSYIGFFDITPGFATFGRYRGDDRILYWREVYQ